MKMTTPGPWEYFLTVTKRIAVITSPDQWLLEIHKSDNPNFEDDARFIVAACNSHDELLEACKMLLDLADNAAEMFPPEDPEDDEIPAILTKARAAIAKANGEA